MAQQLSQHAANVVAMYLVLSPDDQISVFTALSKYQPSLFPAYAPMFHTMSPPPTFKTSVPFAPDSSPENSNNVWENKEVLEVVKEAPVVHKNGTKREKKEPAEPEPITDTCVQVCDQEGCECRYKLSESEQKRGIPPLVMNGIYIYLGQQYRDIRRRRGESDDAYDHRVSNALYIRIAKKLPFRVEEGQLYITRNRAEAQLTLNTHEDAVKVYSHLRQSGIKINWMRRKKERKYDDEDDEERN